MLLNRRAFLAGAAAAAVPGLTGSAPAQAAPYRGRNVVIIRFGGGVRRAEAIGGGQSYAPFLVGSLAKRGVVVPDMSIAELKGVDTSHAEGTLNIITGRYKAYTKVGQQGLAPLLEPNEPTIFDRLRTAYDVAPHEALLINGEDRPQEEFLLNRTHPHHGVAYRSEVVGLYRFKLWYLRRLTDNGTAPEPQLQKARAEIARLTRFDARGTTQSLSPAMERFWQLWEERWGTSGLKNPRGDRLLTELALWSLRHLRPRLMMVNYQDTDYVHWGNPTHYTRAIAIIDQGIAQISAAIEADEAYRGRTVLVVVPDCGRDANPLLAVPYQHHFNTRSAHEIFAVLAGPGIAAGKVLDKPSDQTSIAATIGAIMGFKLPAEGRVLSEVLT